MTGKVITITVKGARGIGKSLLLDRAIGPVLRDFDIVFAIDDDSHQITLCLSDENMRLLTGNIDGPTS